MNITVLGAGAWGTALAKLLRESGHAVTLWGHDATHLAEVRANGRNERYLPGVTLPPGLCYVDNLSEAVRGTGEIILAVPSRAFREVSGLCFGWPEAAWLVARFSQPRCHASVAVQLAAPVKSGAMSSPSLA